MDNLNEGKNQLKIGDIAVILMFLFLSAPLFAGIIDRQMLKDLFTYDAYAYNKCFMYISNSIYVCVLAFVIIAVAITLKKGSRSLLDEFKALFAREQWMIFWGCLLLWSIIPTLCAIDIKGAFFGATELSSGYVSYLFSLAMMGCVCFIDGKGRELLIKYFVIVSNILAIIMLSYEYDIPFLSSFTPPLTGLSVFTNSNHYGYYLTVAIMCMTGQYFISLLQDDKNDKKAMIWRYVYLVSAIFNVYTLIINNTLGAYLAVVFATIFLMVIWKIRYKKMGIMYWIPMIVIVILTILSFFDIITSKLGVTIGGSLVGFVADIFKLSHKSEGYELGGSRRIKIWKETTERIKQHPIVGFGPDMMFDAQGNILMESTPHNEFLECAFFLGIPGLIMYLGGLITLCVDRCKRLMKLQPQMLMAAGVVVGYLISSFFGVRKYHTSPYLYFFLGMLLLGFDKKAEE